MNRSDNIKWIKKNAMDIESTVTDPINIEETRHDTVAIRATLTEEEKREVDEAVRKTMESLKKVVS